MASGTGTDVSATRGRQALMKQMRKQNFNDNLVSGIDGNPKSSRDFGRSANVGLVVLNTVAEWPATGQRVSARIAPTASRLIYPQRVIPLGRPLTKEIVTAL